MPHICVCVMCAHRPIQPRAPVECSICFNCFHDVVNLHCPKCEKITYCSPECLAAHWNSSHRFNCRPCDVEEIQRTYRGRSGANERLLVNIWRCFTYSSDTCGDVVCDAVGMRDRYVRNLVFFNHIREYVCTTGHTTDSWIEDNRRAAYNAIIELPWTVRSKISKDMIVSTRAELRDICKLVTA